MTPWVLKLLVANVLIFLAQSQVPYLEQFVFVPQLLLLRPWTLVTYMFLHGDFMHLLFNMISLYFFGSQVEARLGGQRFLTLYFVSGVAGAVLSMVLARNSAILGASAGVFGVMMAFAMFWPTTRILIWGVLPIEARVLVVLTTLFALYSGMTGSQGGVADYAHLGGYAGGYFYLKWLERNSAARKFRAKVATAGVLPDKHLAEKIPKVNLQGVHELTKEEVNRILDKISAEGIGSLTMQEKLFLSNFVPLDDRKPVA